MNQRIKELLKQSGLQPYYEAQEGQIEKFAELIVRDLIDSMIKRYGDDDELPIQEIEFFVKEHFGVEK